ncbi:MAG: polyphosphate polymerase domain-containing protein [Labilithrix sp.]|nr:polyphosphate polymerase domain-containing protein [Labilithrix sp.]
MSRDVLDLGARPGTAPVARDRPLRDLGAPAPRASPLGLATSTVVRTTFERFELKFWVTAPTADRVVRFARPYLEHDPFSRDGNLTRNVSLYLDTRGYRFHALHTSGAPERLKLRVRTYGDPPTSPLSPSEPSGRVGFFEVKRKVKNITLKARATLPLEHVPAVLSGRPDLASCAPAERRHLETFLFLSALHRVEPKVFIASRREAFVSRTRGVDVRMTIDREIAYQPAYGRHFSAAPHRWTVIDGRGGRCAPYGAARALVELKFRGAAPAWMAEMVARFEMRQEGFSKYIAAIDHLQGKRSGDGDDR